MCCGVVWPRGRSQNEPSLAKMGPDAGRGVPACALTGLGASSVDHFRQARRSRVPHIDVGNQLPGIRSLFEYRPDAAAPLCALAEQLLRGPSELTLAERELIAAYTSSGNGCRFCTLSHAAVARAHYGAEAAVVDAVLADAATAPVDERLRALLRIADRVRVTGQAVGAEHVAAARAAGATDAQVHDTVLIAAAFCMFNRYVDGLATTYPEAPSAYAEMGRFLAEHGYLR
jgi:uncharacterized peroxidase-related enzyme